MSEVWHSVCSLDDVQPGTMHPVEIGDVFIAVYNVDGEYFATDNVCTHGFDLPPLKWSSLKYDFRMEDKINGKEEAYG